MARKKAPATRYVRPEWDYPEAARKLRAALRQGISDHLKRARNAKWYARVTADDPPGSLSHAEWVKSRREQVLLALELRARRRATTF